ERRFSCLGWEIYPHGLYRVLQRFGAYGIPLMITENGVATSDEAVRTDFIAAHVGTLATAMHDGIAVLGYLYWSLFDNFEWTDGYGARFGLAAVDASSQSRLARPAAAFYESICRSNEIAIAGRDAGIRN